MTKKQHSDDQDLELLQLKAERDALQKDLDEALKEVEELKKELEQETPEGLKELAARAQADLQNAKERLERQAGDMRQFALQGLLEKMLPTVDNFRRAFAHLPEDLKDHEWMRGIQAVEQEFLKILEEAGLQRIEALGEQVDPLRHDVLQQGEGPAGEVVEVFEDGYEYNGKILRPAKVKVGSDA